MKISRIQTGVVQRESKVSETKALSDKLWCSKKSKIYMAA